MSFSFLPLRLSRRAKSAHPHHQPQRHARKRRLLLEALEDRRLLVDDLAVHLRLFDTSLVPITTPVPVGTEVVLQATVEDLRETPQGVASAYLDLVFPGGVASFIAGSVTHGVFTLGTSDGTAGAGTITDIGGADQPPPPASGQGDEFLLFSVHFTAIAVGMGNFSATVGTNPVNPTRLYPVPPDFIPDVPMGVIFTGATLEVNDPNARMANPDMPAAFNEDSGAHVFDVLANDTGTGLTITAINGMAGPGPIATTGGMATIVAGQISYTPNPDFNGPDAFTYTINGGGNGATDTATVTVTVDPVNDAPQFNLPALPPAINEDAGAQTVAGFAGGIAPGPATATDEAGQVLTFLLTPMGTTGNLAFTSAPAIDPGTGDLTYTAAPNTNGTATFSVILMDDGGTANTGDDASDAQTFTITVNAINDAPVFDVPQEAPSVSEDVGPQTVPSFATGIAAGPAGATDETTQTLTFILTPAGSTGNLAFSAGPAIDPLTGALTYTPAPHTNGTATFNVVLMDNGGTTGGGDDTSDPQEITITVTAVNDAPSFTLAGNPPTILPGAGAQTVNSFATNILPGPAAATDEAGQILNFLITPTGSTGTLAFDVAPAIDPLTGTLTYTPTGTTTGTATFSVVLMDDGGTADGGDDTSEAQSFTITVTAEVNDPPSFTIPAQPPTISEDAGSQSVPGFATNISAGPPDESSQTLTFILTPMGTTGNLAFTLAPAISPTGTLAYTPAPNTNGTATFSVVLMDNGGTAGGGDDTSEPQTITITVTAVNDAPVFTIPANPPTVNEDAPAQTVAGFATGIAPGPAAATDEAGQTLTFTLTPTGTTGNLAFTTAPAIDPITGALTYTLAPNTSGTATFSVTLMDNGGTAGGGDDTSDPQTFTITATAVNDAPTFTLPGNPPAINEDAGSQTVNNFATGISAGPADESSQTLTFILTPMGTTGNLAFTLAPAISSTGTLAYTVAPNTNGTATFSVVLMDNGGTANGGDDTSEPQTFTITVNAVNDAPVFAIPASPPAVNEDAPAQTVNNFATGIAPGPAAATDEAGQTLTFVLTPTGTTGNLAFSTPPAISPTGTLTYTLAPNTNGTATFSVVLQDDGGTSNGGDNTSDAQTFTITVNAVNDAPVFTLPTAPTAVNEDAGAQSVAGFATGIAPGPAGATDEAGQTLTFVLTPNGTTGNLTFTTAPTISATGVLTYTASPNSNGTATFNVVLQDNGGTANGGVNTSPVQSFTITVNAVNDAPSFTLAGNPPAIAPGAGPQTVTNFATNISPGPADEAGQTLTFNVTVITAGGLTFTTAPAIDPTTGTLTYTVAAGSTGTATIGVTLSDNGSNTPPNVNTSAQQTFLISVGLSSISGLVWCDIDQDGVKDAKEHFLQNVTITLTGTATGGGAVNRTTTTAADGSYSFADVAPGTYALAETHPAPFVDGVERVGSLGGTAAALGSDQISGIVLAGNTNGTNYHFTEKGLVASAAGVGMFLCSTNGGFVLQQLLPAPSTNSPSGNENSLRAAPATTTTSQTAKAAPKAAKSGAVKHHAVKKTHGAAKKAKAAAKAKAVKIKAVPPAPVAAPIAAPAPPAIQQTDLAPIVRAALDRWTAAGLSTAQTARLQNVSVKIADLPGDQIGTADRDSITVDLDAAGQGWFVDSTPGQDEEYAVVSGRLASTNSSGDSARIDLLTAVMHEMGHLLGIEHGGTRAADLMAETLAAGERKLPEPSALDEYFAST